MSVRPSPPLRGRGRRHSRRGGARSGPTHAGRQRAGVRRRSSAPTRPDPGRQPWPDGQVGLEVRRRATGDVLYEHNAENRLLPASNGKLFTSTAAMDVLGPDYRFTTSVQTNGPTSHGHLSQPVPRGHR